MDSMKQTLEADKIKAMKDVHAQKGSKSLYAGQHLAEAEARLAAIRASLTAISKLETSFRDRRDLSNEEVVIVLRKEVAQRLESARVYGEAGESDRQSRELAEAAVLEAYLPAQLDEAATRELVGAIIADQNLSGPQAIGLVMAAMKTRSDVDKGMASKLARELL